MTTVIERVLSLLDGVNRSGSGRLARCPAHDDHHPSLSISQTPEGTVLLHCHAGCTVESICAALGLRVADLFAGRLDALSKPKRQRLPVTTYATAREAVEVLERRYGRRSVVRTYHGINGSPVGVVVRWDRPDGKIIRPVSLHDTRWVIGGMRPPRPLYRLLDLASADLVYVVEGEKAAEAARSAGLVATTSAHGANGAAQTDWMPLAGKTAVIVPDNDEAGMCYADEVAQHLLRLVPRPTVKELLLPGLPEGGDLADYIAAREVVS